VSGQSVGRDLLKSFLSRERLASQTRARSGRLRLLGLLVLFDILLIAAVVLSFQRAELVEEVIELEQTREVYATVIIEQVITNTTVITQVIPYGSVE
jgi:hypothetical protein